MVFCIVIHDHELARTAARKTMEALAAADPTPRLQSLVLQEKTQDLYHGCQIAKFDPFLSLDCARVEGVGAQSKERKGSNFAA